MANPLNNINKALKTKEDSQHLVLIALVLFILFVKCYMLFTDNTTKQTANNTPNKVKATTVNNNI